MHQPGTPRVEFLVGDCLEVMRSMPDRSVDLVFCSPPYEDARLYGELGFKVKGQDWVDWCVPRFRECLRVCRGLVAWVVEGKTRKFQYSCTPQLLIADLHRSGVTLRKPPVFHRVGIAGSGGPDWLRNDHEIIVCATNGGKLPWSCNTACGHPPKWAPGGEMSHRTVNGHRVNQWGHSIGTGGTVKKGPDHETCGSPRPSHRLVGSMLENASEPKHLALLAGDVHGKLHTKNDGEKMRVQCYTPPVMANPGNVLHYKVGGGLMGHRLAHENEAPFPLGLAEFFVKSFCPPGGVVLDPFVGSGTTLHAAVLHGRNAIGVDQRQCQIDLSKRRIEDVMQKMEEA